MLDVAHTVDTQDTVFTENPWFFQTFGWLWDVFSGQNCCVRVKSSTRHAKESAESLLSPDDKIYSTKSREKGVQPKEEREGKMRLIYI